MEAGRYLDLLPILFKACFGLHLEDLIISEWILARSRFLEDFQIFPAPGTFQRTIVSMIPLQTLNGLELFFDLYFLKQIYNSYYTKLSKKKGYR